MTGTLNNKDKKEWPEWESALYQQQQGLCQLSNVWTQTLLSIDVEYGVTLPEISDKSCQNYAQKLESRLKWAFQVAKEHNKKELVQHKQYHDWKLKCMQIDVGDQVLVGIKAFGTDHKIADR